MYYTYSVQIKRNHQQLITGYFFPDFEFEYCVPSDANRLGNSTSNREVSKDSGAILTNHFHYSPKMLIMR